jgi:hypothetical protein
MSDRLLPVRARYPLGEFIAAEKFFVGSSNERTDLCCCLADMNMSFEVTAVSVKPMVADRHERNPGDHCDYEN